MRYGKRILPISFTTNAVDEPITAFDNTALTPQFEQRLYDGKYIYEAYTNIYPLATYSWNHISEAENGICTKLDDKTTVVSTAVPCVKDITTVYIIDTYRDITNLVDGKYFKFIGTTGDIDFNTIDPTSPSGWAEVVNHRHFDAIPSESSIYWKYVDVINSQRHLDGTVYTQTTLDVGTTISNEYLFDAIDFIDTIAFFNIDLTSIEITVRLQDDTIVVPTFSLDLQDYQGITIPYEWHFTSLEGALKKNTFTSIDIYSDIKIQIDYINTNGNPKVGETFFTKSTDMGVTLNRPQGRKKNFDRISIDPITGIKTRVKSKTLVDEVTYNVLIPTEALDSKITTWSNLINEDILIIGDETGTFTNLIHFCYIQEFPYEIDSTSTHNTYQIKLTTLA